MQPSQGRLAATAARRRHSQAPRLAVSFRQLMLSQARRPGWCPHAPAPSLPHTPSRCLPRARVIRRRFVCLLACLLACLFVVVVVVVVVVSTARAAPSTRLQTSTRYAVAPPSTAPQSASRLESTLVSPNAIPRIAPDRAEKGPWYLPPGTSLALAQRRTSNHACPRACLNFAPIANFTLLCRLHV